MRSFLLIFFIIACSAIAIAIPYVGLLTWSWLTIMSPQNLAWLGPTTLGLNDIIAVATIIGWLLACLTTREPITPPSHPISWLLILFAAWLGISQLFSLFPDYSQPYFDRFFRVMVFIILCSIMIRDKVRIQAMIWLVSFCIGVLALKGGMFTLLRGGANIVFGPPGTTIVDNNHFGTAIATIIPLFVYLYQTSRHQWTRFALVGLIATSVLAALGTQSRGAFISLCALSVFYLLQTQRKIFTFAAIFIIAVPAVLFMPENWSNRMQTMQDIENVSSFETRRQAWSINYKVALLNPLTGGGLRVPYSDGLMRQYLADSTLDARAAHSIYFEILGGTGFVGLAIFLSLLLSALVTTRRIKRLARGKPGLDWAYRLGSASQISLATFLVGGAGVSMEMWEGYLLVIVFINAANEIVRKELSESAPAIRGQWWSRAPQAPITSVGTSRPNAPPEP